MCSWNLWCINIQSGSHNIDLSTRLWEINPTNSSYFPEPRLVYLNWYITKAHSETMARVFWTQKIAEKQSSSCLQARLLSEKWPCKAGREGACLFSSLHDRSRFALVPSRSSAQHLRRLAEFTLKMSASCIVANGHWKTIESIYELQTDCFSIL